MEPSVSGTMAPEVPTDDPTRWPSQGVDRGVVHADASPLRYVSEGHGEDFTTWVAPHLRPMANLATRLVGASDRDDVVQESLARAWRRRSTYRADRGSARAWLLAIVADQARRTRTRKVRRQVPVDDAAPRSERDLDLEAAIRALPRRQRRAVELHYLVDLSVADVAVVMGCSEGTVKSTLFDARATLRRELGDR